MKVVHLTCWLSSQLLLVSSQATAQPGVKLEVSEIQKITDASQGGFRPFIEFSVAGQVMRGLLDTGSSDLNIPKTGSDFCRSEGEQCDGRATGFKAGSLDVNKNKTQIRDLNLPLNATFTGGAAFVGKFIESSLQVTPGGKAVPVQMGLVESGGVPPGQVSFPVMGIGPVQGESTNNLYPNVPARFKQDSLSRSNAYGLYLGDFRSPDNGSLVWGGFDAAKCEGELKIAPLVATEDGALPSFVVDFSSVGLAPSRDTGRGNNSQERPSRQEGSFPESDDSISWSGEFKRSVFTSHRLDNARVPSYVHTSQGLSARDLLRRQRRGNLLSNDAPPVAWLDTGVPSIVLPAGTLDALGKRLGARPGPQGEFLADCSRIRGMDLTLGLNKDNVQVRVPLDSIIATPDPGRGAREPGNARLGNSRQPQKDRNRGGANNQNNRKDRGGNRQGSSTPKGNSKGNNNNIGSGASPGSDRAETCELALAPVEGDGPTDIPVLGAPALQSMYVVFDMDSKALMIAQAKMNETKTDIREYIAAGGG
ncbi:hypothetical protein J3459_015725 [Metarhizium acridum]|uniref:Aspartic protease n=1 Tax=Metarhizium acridum (strain CQMa 102) TaxID=655827 RepID=E9E9S4_METAQ|nr:aspartic protease [Metarhizium acridum CQMa 102]EFY87387.1 aspartic protease [Metarhizium acridum CQMa 102]KAG8411363.1 hypothetical protein J3458_015426 [Metarhizium acridum]KAG8413158.1 hypothetical protein J3459_015725 [Metarhizium acridum]